MYKFLHFPGVYFLITIFALFIDASLSIVCQLAFILLKTLKIFKASFQLLKVENILLKLILLRTIYFLIQTAFPSHWESL